jgi:hypothetical protein
MVGGIQGDPEVPARLLHTPQRTRGTGLQDPGPHEDRRGAVMLGRVIVGAAVFYAGLIALILWAML